MACTHSQSSTNSCGNKLWLCNANCEHEVEVEVVASMRGQQIAKPVPISLASGVTILVFEHFEHFEHLSI